MIRGMTVRTLRSLQRFPSLLKLRRQAATKAGGQSKPYTVSFFGTIALATAVIVYLFSTTFDPADVSHFFVMIILLLAGVVLSVVMVGVRFIPFNTKSLLLDLLSTGASFVCVFVINKIVPAEIGVSPIGELSFGILAGVAEGWFFHLWLVGWLNKITGTALIAVPVTSFIWAIFHLNRYGANPNLIGLIFLAGLPLGLFTILFRSNDGPTFGHMIVNALVRHLGRLLKWEIKLTRQ